MKDKTISTLETPPGGADHSQRELERRIFHLKALYDVSREIGFLRGIHDITENLLLMIMGTFGSLSGVFLLLDNNSDKLEAVTQRGIDENSMDLLSRAIESGGFKEIGEVDRVRILSNNDNTRQGDEKNVFDLLSSSNINIWISFKVNENLRGGIGLGDKLSGEPYTPDDQELLNTLSTQGSVAIQNAKLVEQMKKEEIVRTNLSRYLSPQIVDQIVKKDVQLNLGGDRKVVTVLFSDVRDFTTITETRPPDQLIHILNEYFTEMARIIFVNQGSLDKYIGDALVAVFGSLIPIENPAVNAIQTAIQMMKNMPVLNEHWMKKFGFSMDIGIGISTGEVFLGNIGSQDRMEFTVIGDTVNVASRFSCLAEAGQILMTEQTCTSLGTSDIRYKEHPPSAVKGKSGKLEVFEILYS